MVLACASSSRKGKFSWSHFTKSEGIVGQAKQQLYTEISTIKGLSLDSNLSLHASPNSSKYLPDDQK